MAPFSSNTTTTTTKYDQLFREAFAQRTVLTLIHFSILYFILSIFIEIFIPTSSRSTPLSLKWLLEHCPTILSFIPMLLISLKPLASSATSVSSSSTTSSPNDLFHSFILHLVPFLILNSSSLLQTPFIDGFSSGAAAAASISPKPHILLVKPFYILLNAILISITSNIVMVFRYRSIVIPLHQERPHFPSLFRGRMRGFVRRSSLTLGITFGIILFDSFFLGGGRPCIYHLAHFFLSKVLPLSEHRSNTSGLFSYFGSFSTVFLLLKLALTAFYTLFLHHLMDLLIEVNFGSPFNLVINQFCSSSSCSNEVERHALARTLLDGLSTSSSLESMQAFMELEHILSSEDDHLIVEWRREMWRGVNDTDDGVYGHHNNADDDDGVIMSSLLNLLLHRLDLISEKLSNDRKDLSFIKDQLDKRGDLLDSTKLQELVDGHGEVEETVTYPLPNMFRDVKKEMSSSKTATTISPLSPTSSKDPSYTIRDPYLRIIWLSVNQLDTRNSLLKDLALSAIEIRKSYMLIGDSVMTFSKGEEANLSLLLSSLILLIKDSLLTERNDVHSIVQLRIGDIYSSLIRLHDSYSAFEKDGLCGGALGRRCRRLKDEVVETLDAISYPSPLLSKEVKEGLEKIL